MHLSMAWCRTTVSPLLTPWRYCSLALSHQYVSVKCELNSHRIRLWLSTNQEHSHYLNQWCLIVSWTLIGSVIWGELWCLHSSLWNSGKWFFIHLDGLNSYILVLTALARLENLRRAFYYSPVILLMARPAVLNKLQWKLFQSTISWAYERSA